MSLIVNKLGYQVANKQLLNQISFSLNNNEAIALLGPNGAGKSSLLKLLAGEMKPTSGSFKFTSDNQELPIQFSSIGYQPSHMEPIKYLSVLEYLHLCCYLKGIAQDAVEAEVKTLAKQWFFESYLLQPLASLSQGNMQKIAIAQAFLGSPKYILLDEPAQALDPLEQQRLIQNINQVKQSSSLIFSSHHFNEAVSAADRILLLDRGELIISLDLTQADQRWLIIERPDSDCLAILNNNENIQIRSQTKHFIIANFLVQSELEVTACCEPLSEQNVIHQVYQSSRDAILPIFELLSNNKD
ncbi:ATP-binding cassette domain-containing protein [Aliikangiella sp. IMCC44653]